jgi:hypothetical protein
MAQRYVQRRRHETVGGLEIQPKYQIRDLFCGLISFFLIFVLISSSCINVLASSGVNVDDDEGDCKVIVAMNDVTAGEYNLHMKVRDPSRGGGQVLFILDPGYNYTYHHPITNETLNFTVSNRIIGTATAGDILPSILKSGMVLTSAGISIGDVDNPTLEHLNRNETAWDDFDWMRFAFQTANSEDEAVRLLTEVAVDELHATGIGEILFVVGPEKGYAIEADAEHYYVHEIEDVFVKSNYPEFLWESCSYFKTKYAPTFETKFDDWVVKNQTIKLGENCSRGVTIINISENSIVARLYPDDGKNVTIHIGENKSVYNFRVGLVDTEFEVDDSQVYATDARITICYKYLEWRENVYNLVNTRKGEIKVQDMIKWSRLHEDDMDGLRGFCEGSETRQEVVNIFKHPLEKPELMSSLWFAGIPCSSLYVPVHSSVEYIYGPYRNGEAWNITLDLLQNYTHGELTPVLDGIEEVFLNENDKLENICFKFNDTMNESLIKLLTISDNMLQNHAYKMETILLDLAKLESLNITKLAEELKTISETIKNMWKIDYNTSFMGLKNAIIEVENLIGEINSTRSPDNNELISILEGIRNKVFKIIKRASELKYREAFYLINHSHPDMREAQLNFQLGLINISMVNYSAAADNFIKVFQLADNLLQAWPDIPEPKEPNNGKPEDNDNDSEKEPDKDGSIDPIDIEPENNETDKDKVQWSNIDYMLVTGIILLVIILAGINVIGKRKK